MKGKKCNLFLPHCKKNLQFLFSTHTSNSLILFTCSAIIAAKVIYIVKSIFLYLFHFQFIKCFGTLIANYGCSKN